MEHLLYSLALALVLPAAPARAQTTQMPPGIERVEIINNASVLVARLTFAPGAREPVHTHPFSALAYCPSCGSGYGVGPIRCVDCDRELVPRSWVEARAGGPTIEPGSVEVPVPLGDVANPFKAHLLGSALNAESIWFVSEPGPWSAVRFLVLPRDLERARLVLSDLDDLEKQADRPESAEEG